jgi:hypothetical protein
MHGPSPWRRANVSSPLEDVTQQFPGKYNQGLNEMLDHHVDNNRITPQQRDDIKAQCNL